MSCLNLRFPPAKKAWKSFATKLLHKLRMSRAIKKPKSNYNVTTATALTAAKAIIRRPTPPVLFDKRHKKRRRLVYPSQTHVLPSKRFHFKKKSAPVYIDKLFREPGRLVAVTVTEFASSAKASVKPIDDQQATSTAVKETSADIQDGEAGGEAGDHEIMADDDMWESLGFASPQLRGIDERAEQFISSFRADMEIQEMIASSL